MTNLRCRLITAEDSADVLNWRNDFTSRQMSLNAGIVLSTEHSNWFSKMLDDNSHLGFIGEITGEKIIRANIKDVPPELVYINPEACIGCTICIQKCPVDAIAGAEGFLHTVIVDECNGCGICVSSCPVDCITEKKRTKDNPWTDAKANMSKTRFYEKKAREKKLRIEAGEERLDTLKELLFREEKG